MAKGIAHRFWPASLAGRTALVLILGLMAVQALGLTIHAFDRVELQRASEARENSVRAFNLWRALVISAPERRTAILAEADLPSTLTASYDTQATTPLDLRPIPLHIARLFRVEGPGAPARCRRHRGGSGRWRFGPGS